MRRGQVSATQIAIAGDPANRLGARIAAVPCVAAAEFGHPSARRSPALFFRCVASESDNQRGLADLLREMFTADELRRFTLELPSGRSLRNSIVWEQPLAALTLELGDALKRHGLLGSELFDALLRERPGRADEIRDVAASLGMVGRATGPQVEASDRRVPSLDAGEPIFKVFRTAGPPDSTFVAPSQLPEIAARLEFRGEGLVVEGASGVGKTTAVRSALEALKANGGATATEWIAAKDPVDLKRLQQIVAAGAGSLSGYLVVDDFHRVPPETRAAIADLIKVVADAGRDDCKIVLVGINPVGDTLVTGADDLTGRFVVVSMNRQPQAKIDELLAKGERAANVEFERRDDIVVAARGSFFTAQMLCLEICMMEGVTTTQAVPRRLAEGPSGRVVDRLRDKLKFKYHKRLITLASHGMSRPARGATLALLRLLRESFDEGASMALVKNREPELAAEIDWLLKSNMRGFLEQEPSLTELFFYNRDAGILSAEDPQLDFYLDAVEWPALARDAGLRDVAWDGDKPVFGPVADHEPQRPRHAPAAQPHARVLHLSDLHISDRTQAVQFADQLREDLYNGLKFEKLTACVVSGDITNRGTPSEFDAAEKFFRLLRDYFGLHAESIVLVPGNHDMDWGISQSAYVPVRRKEWGGPRDDASHHEAGDYVEVAQRQQLEQRLKAFANFHFEVRHEQYSLDAENQATVHHIADAQLLFLGLNSSWAIDHHHTDRADINSLALGHALSRIDREPDYKDALRIAVWHHPLQGPGPDRITDTGFIERLAQSGFRLGLHGHIHKARVDLFRLEIGPKGRRLDVLGAGTFGAAVRDWQPGYPLQYQVLEFNGGGLTVHTRRREEPNGAWKPDARWTQDRGSDPSPRYTIEL